jgi:hypothetical protein
LHPLDYATWPSRTVPYLPIFPLFSYFPQATRATGIRDLPRLCPWDAEQVLTDDWLPED